MASIDIDITDLVYGMSSCEKQGMVDELYSEGYIAENYEHSGATQSMDVFDEGISKMLGNSWKLTKEDEEIVLRISNKILK